MNFVRVWMYLITAFFNTNCADKADNDGLILGIRFYPPNPHSKMLIPND